MLKHLSLSLLSPVTDKICALTDDIVQYISECFLKADSETGPPLPTHGLSVHFTHAQNHSVRGRRGLWAFELATCMLLSRCWCLPNTHTHTSGLPIIFMLLSQTANINRLSNCNENILHQPVCVWERDRLFFQSPALQRRPERHRLQDLTLQIHKSKTFISLTSLANSCFLF